MEPELEGFDRWHQPECPARHQHSRDASPSPPRPDAHCYSLSEGCESPHLLVPTQQACEPASLDSTGRADGSSSHWHSSSSSNLKAMRRQQEEMALIELEEKLRLLEVKRQVSEMRCRQFVAMLEESMRGGEEVCWREGDGVQGLAAADASGRRPSRGRGSDGCQWYSTKIEGEDFLFDQTLAWRGKGTLPPVNAKEKDRRQSWERDLLFYDSEGSRRITSTTSLPQTQWRRLNKRKWSSTGSRREVDSRNAVPRAHDNHSRALTKGVRSMEREERY